MSLDTLSFEHEEQAKNWLKFLRGKRERQVKEVEACFEDQREMFQEDMYTRDEVTRMLGSLQSAVRSTVMTDQQMTANMSVLLIRQMFEEAEAAEIDMDLDMTIVEDHNLLSEVSKIAIDAPTRKDRRRKNVKLDGIRDEHQRMMRDFESLKEENAKLQKSCASLERKLGRAKSTIGSRDEEIEQLRKTLDIANRKLDSIQTEAAAAQLPPQEEVARWTRARWSPPRGQRVLVTLLHAPRGDSLHLHHREKHLPPSSAAQGTRTMNAFTTSSRRPAPSSPRTVSTPRMHGTPRLKESCVRHSSGSCGTS